MLHGAGAGWRGMDGDTEILQVTQTTGHGRIDVHLSIIEAPSMLGVIGYTAHRRLR
jgi:hypothetical protein